MNLINKNCSNKQKNTKRCHYVKIFILIIFFLFSIASIILFLTNRKLHNERNINSDDIPFISEMELNTEEIDSNLTLIEESKNLLSSEDCSQIPETNESTDISSETVLTIPDIEVPYEKSGFVVCIDPGHYKGYAPLEGDHIYDYEEGSYTLKIALALKQELEKYGIDSYLTRENDSITLDNYTDLQLDHGHVRLRGNYAKGADLFVSIHTNANHENANNCGTCNQPLSINKTIIILNKLAREDTQYIQMANCIGRYLTSKNYEYGISYTSKFQTADISTIREWSIEFNDALYTEGTLVYRLGDNGDYYGVLNGSNEVGVPGMIIEHGFHTVEEVRYLAVHRDLATEWAKADAYGIALGFGIVEEK